MWAELADAQGGIDDLMLFAGDVVDTLRVALVGYRDQRDEFETKVWDFTPDIALARRRLWSLTAGGGGDRPEAVYPALRLAYTRLGWRPELLGLGNAPGMHALATDPIPELRLALEHQHARSRLGHDLGERRASQTSTDRNQVIRHPDLRRALGPLEQGRPEEPGHRRCRFQIQTRSPACDEHTHTQQRMGHGLTPWHALQDGTIKPVEPSFAPLEASVPVSESHLRRRSRTAASSGRWSRPSWRGRCGFRASGCCRDWPMPRKETSRSG